MNADLLMEVFTDSARENSITSGEVLFRLGDVPEYLFLILDGEARAHRYSPDGAEIVMQRARVGELFAEAGLVAPRYSCEGYCSLPSRLLRIPLLAVRSRIAGDGEFALRFAEFQAMAMRRQCSRVECLRIKRAGDRVMHYLNCEGPVMAASGTIQDLARELGLEPETLYRTLAELETAGLIQRHGKGIRLAIESCASGASSSAMRSERT